MDTYTYVLSLMGVNGVKFKDGPKYWKLPGKTMVACGREKSDFLSPEHIPEWESNERKKWIMGVETKKEKENDATLPYHPCHVTSAEASPQHSQAPSSEVTGSCDFDLWMPTKRLEQMCAEQMCSAEDKWGYKDFALFCFFCI